MPHLICYDIHKNSLRSKIAKKILTFGLDRINKSVYLGSLSESSLTKLETQLSQWVKTGEPQDSLIIISVNAQQVHDMRVFGKNDLDKDELTGEKDTLIL